MTLQEGQRIANKLREMGFQILAGPFENPRYQEVHGVRLVRIKTVLTQGQLDELGIKLDAPDKPENPRSLRFAVSESDGQIVLTHVSTSRRRHRRPKAERRVHSRRKRSPS